MRKALAAAVLLVLAACGGGVHRDLERYYDPGGLFSAELPSENQVQVLPPQGGDASQGPVLLGGVQSVPAPPSPSATGFSTLGDLAGAVARDQTAFYVFAVTSQSLTTAEDLATLYTSQPGVDVKIRQPVRVGTGTGLLVVADTETQTGAFSVASAFLVEGEVGYWIAAAFPRGDWDKERGDFLRILASFRSEVPPAVGSVPLAGS